MASTTEQEPTEPITLQDAGEGASPDVPVLLRTIVALRLLSAIAVLGSLVGATLMFIIGSVTTVEAIRTYVDGEESMSAKERGLATTIELVSALDEYLFGLLLFVFAIGIYQLFLVHGDTSPPRRVAGLPRWLHVRDLLELKIMLVELILVVFIVQFFRVVLSEVEQFEWTLLTVPIAVGIFAVVLWVLRSGERESGG